MKRYLALTLALSLCLGLFAACGKTEESKQPEEPAKEETDMFADSMQKRKNNSNITSQKTCCVRACVLYV